MRTLTTQMRLRRLLRVATEYQDRLRSEGRPGPVAAASSARLLQLLDDVRAAWDREGVTLAVPGLRSYVSRSFAAMLASLAALAMRGADPERLHGEFRDAALPLLFFLRGLDDSEASVLAELEERPPLRRSA